MAAGSLVSPDEVAALVILPNLAPGGAQKQGLILARQLSESGTSTAIFLTHSTTTTDSNKELSAGMPIIFAGDVVKKIPLLERIDNILLTIAQRASLGRATQLLKKRLSIRILRGLKVPPEISRNLETNLKISIASRAIRKTLDCSAPNLMISFLPQSNIATLLGSNTRPFVVVVERNDFVRQDIGAGIRRAQSLTYPMADLVAANSKNAVRQMAKHFPKNRVVFAPNTYPAPVEEALREERSRTILVVGRLELQKRPVEVLRAFLDSGIGSRGWKLVFVGSGSLEKKLRGIADSASRPHEIELRGHVPSGQIPYHEASITVLNSDYEGSPNVLAEAIAWGVVPLVRDSVTEAKEFIPGEKEKMLMFSDQAQLTQTLRDIETIRGARVETMNALIRTYERRLNEYGIARRVFLDGLKQN